MKAFPTVPEAGSNTTTTTTISSTTDRGTTTTVVLLRLFAPHRFARGLFPPFRVAGIGPQVPNHDGISLVHKARFAKKAPHAHPALGRGQSLHVGGARQHLLLPQGLGARFPVRLAALEIGAARQAGRLGAAFAGHALLAFGALVDGGVVVAVIGCCFLRRRRLLDLIMIA